MCYRSLLDVTLVSLFRTSLDVLDGSPTMFPSHVHGLPHQRHARGATRVLLLLLPCEHSDRWLPCTGRCFRSVPELLVGSNLFNFRPERCVLLNPADLFWESRTGWA